MNAAPARPLIGVTYSSAELDEFVLWRQMFHGVVAAGGTPVAIDCVQPVRGIEDLVARLDGLILSGGGDVDPRRYGGDPDDPALRGVNPARDDAEVRALTAARKGTRPVLAICRGAQLVNAVLGGTLYADLARDRPSPVSHRERWERLDAPLHKVEVAAGSILAAWMGADGILSVNSQHHQGIRELADALVPSAWAPDGLVEGFELPGERLVGVQWHPEVLWPAEAHARTLMSTFIHQCVHALASRE